MSAIQAGIADAVSVGPLLSPGDALWLLLYLASAVVLVASTVSAGGALLFRTRTIAKERVTKERSEQWQGALHRFLYDGADAETLWSTVDQDSRMDFLNFLLLYVRRLEGEEREAVCRLAEPNLLPILEQLDASAEGLRMRTVQTLGELGLPRYGDQVIAALDDPSPVVAMVAASTLARAETPEERARAYNRELGAWDGVGRYRKVQEVVQRALRETGVSRETRMKLQVNLAISQVAGREIDAR